MISTETVELVDGVSPALEVEAAVVSGVDGFVAEEASDEPAEARPVELDEAASELDEATAVESTVDDEPVLGDGPEGALLDVSVSVKVLSKDDSGESEDELDPGLLPSRSDSDRLLCCVVDWMSKVTG